MSTSYVSHFARKARLCSTDAVILVRHGRPDLAVMMRAARDTYLHQARLLAHVCADGIQGPFPKELAQ